MKYCEEKSGEPEDGEKCDWSHAARGGPTGTAVIYEIPNGRTGGMCYPGNEVTSNEGLRVRVDKRTHRLRVVSESEEHVELYVEPLGGGRTP